jgi:hypothetical protein
MAVKNQTGAQRGWPQRKFSGLQGQPGVPLIVIAIYSVVCLAIYGATDNHYLFMLLGSVASMVGAFLHVLSSFIYGVTGRKSWLAAFMVAAGLVPWLFGSYIVVYEGFWGFKELSSGFSVWVVAKSLAAVLLGFVVVIRMYEITEEDRRFSAW